MKTILLGCVLISLSFISSKKSQDEEDIKRLLEKESATWRSGDVAAHASCWSIQPYSRILVSLADGTALDVPPKFMIEPSANSMGHGGSSVNSDYKMCIHDHFASVSHNEVSTTKEGVKSYSYELRLLEKIDGEWKLTGQSIHVYHPK